MKYAFLLLGALVALPFVSSSQDWNIGKTKVQIETELKSKKGANISYGINNEGLAFLMDEDWDGTTAWYFDDNAKCIAFYMALKSEEGRKTIVDLKLALSGKFEKVNANTYCDDENYCFTFSSPTPKELALLVLKRE